MKSIPKIFISIESELCDDPGINLIMALSAVMKRFESIPDNEKAAALDWFFSKYSAEKAGNK